MELYTRLLQNIFSYHSIPHDMLNIIKNGACRVEICPAQYSSCYYSDFNNAKTFEDLTIHYKNIKWDYRVHTILTKYPYIILYKLVHTNGIPWATQYKYKSFAYIGQHMFKDNAINIRQLRKMVKTYNGIIDIVKRALGTNAHMPCYMTAFKSNEDSIKYANWLQSIWNANSLLVEMKENC